MEEEEERDSGHIYNICGSILQKHIVGKYRDFDFHGWCSRADRLQSRERHITE
jgi:hypothetical protein